METSKNTQQGTFQCTTNQDGSCTITFECNGKTCTIQCDCNGDNCNCSTDSNSSGNSCC